MIGIVWTTSFLRGVTLVNAVDEAHRQPALGHGTFFPRRPLSAWGAGVEAAPGQASAAPDVVHFLFLVDRGLSHAGVWERFFDQAPRGSFRIWVHCTRPGACEADRVTALPTATVVPTVPSAYCYDLVTPATQLMRFALAASVAAPGAVEKFVLMSDTSLPVKPFDAVHRALTADDDSDICVAPVSDWRHAHIDGIKVYLAKHSQWVVLNRAHAAMMVERWTPSKTWDRFLGWWSVEVRTGMAGSRARSVPARRFMTHMKAGAYACTDEQAVIATLFGALEFSYDGKVALPGLGRPVLADGALAAQELSFSPPASQGMQGRCRTFTVFQFGQPLGNLTAEVMDAIGSDAQSSTAFVDPDASHPLVFKHLGPRLVKALRVSPFLFARKFDPGNGTDSTVSGALGLAQRVGTRGSLESDPLLALVEPLDSDTGAPIGERAAQLGALRGTTGAAQM